jgi:hypothetical protein
VTHSAWSPATTNRFPSSTQVGPDTRLLGGHDGQPLRIALDAVYRAFADVRLDDAFNACRHCFTESDLGYLRATPLGDLTWSDIAFILSKATTTLGSARDFGYFLPRLLEGLVIGIHYMPDVLAGKVLASRPAWNETQVRAVAEFVTTLELVVHASPENRLLEDCREFVKALRNRID